MQHKFKWLRPELLYVDAITLDDYKFKNSQSLIHVQSEEANPHDLMIATILKDADSDDENLNQLCKTGVQILCKAYEANNPNRVYAYPIGKQKFLEPGEYFISVDAVVGPYECEQTEREEALDTLYPDGVFPLLDSASECGEGALTAEMGGH